MSDDERDPPTKPETPAARAIRLAIVRRQDAEQQQREQTSMDERAAEVLRSSVAEQTAAAERSAARFKVLVLHAGHAALSIVTYALKVLLPPQWQPLGELLFEGALFLWGKSGFKPREPVLALTLAKLEPKRLDRMLSLRPPAAGNSLFPPPAPLEQAEAIKPEGGSPT